MIKLNNRDCEWEEGLTVEELLKRKNYTYARIIVLINAKSIAEEDYSSTTICDGDKVEAIHLMAGG